MFSNKLILFELQKCFPQKRTNRLVWNLDGILPVSSLILFLHIMVCIVCILAQSVQYTFPLAFLIREKFGAKITCILWDCIILSGTLRSTLGGLGGWNPPQRYSTSIWLVQYLRPNISHASCGFCIKFLPFGNKLKTPPSLKNFYS